MVYLSKHQKSQSRIFRVCIINLKSIRNWFVIRGGTIHTHMIIHQYYTHHIYIEYKNLFMLTNDA